MALYRCVIYSKSFWAGPFLWFSQCGSDSNIQYRSIQCSCCLIPDASQPFVAQHRITNVSLLLSRVLVCAIFALFMFVLFVSFAFYTTMSHSCWSPVNKVCVLNYYCLVEIMTRHVGSFNPRRRKNNSISSRKTTKKNSIKQTNQPKINEQYCVAPYFDLGQNSDLLCLTGIYSLQIQLTWAQTDTILLESRNPLQVFLECSKDCPLGLRGTPCRNICHILGQRKCLEQNANKQH